MPRLRRRASATWSTRTLWHPRACVRQAVALRVDYATAQGQVGLGLVRNLSLQGMYMESASGHGTPEMTPGDLLTVAFVLPSGRPCKLRAVIIHGDRHGCGVQFREGHPQSFAHLSNYWSALEDKGR
jgi:PilZ domain